MINKIIFGVAIIFASFIFSSDPSFLFFDQKVIFPCLFTIIGLCLTSYLFVYPLIKKDEERLYQLIDNVIREAEEDILFIFYIGIIIVLLDGIRQIDVPFFTNAKNINLGGFIIHDLKQYFINILVFIGCSLCMYSFHDIIKLSFKLLRNEK